MCRDWFVDLFDAAEAAHVCGFVNLWIYGTACVRWAAHNVKVYY